ncbi:5-formyltetrahydrofolate cyclo-ligase [Parafrankia soli]|uniref:5-formyltetrahydrofolate cyclo-ligase n=1 Tax=Parafrankia soli TaxID=2599596 RepID=UPI001F515D42|nr:5-formyltetrahydrofolate cyclo-ligase [Parafrankia soli]
MTGGTVTGSGVVGRSGSERDPVGPAGSAAADLEITGSAAGSGSGADGSGDGAETGIAAGPGSGLGTRPGPVPAYTRPGAPQPKSELRRRLLALRRAGVLPDPTVLTERLLALPEVTAASCVAAYVGMADEPDTAEILTRLRARGVRVLLPVVRADLDLDFREFAGTLIPGAMGTREPPPSAPLVELAKADVVIVPALAADERGNRLGRGGGSYDRALTRATPGTPVIALLNDRELLGDVPAKPHDRPVTIIVTPTRIVRPAPL